MRALWLALALVGCADFEPTLLDFQRRLPGLVELGGVAADGRGLRALGLSREGENRSQFSTFHVTDTGATGTPQAYGGAVEGFQASGLLALPDGGWLAYGHNGSAVVGLLLDADGERRQAGTLGQGATARAAASGGGLVAVAGQANVGDGSGDRALWAGVFRVTGDEVALVGEDTWRVDGSTAAEAWAVAARAGGGFLVGGSFAGPVDAQPVVLTLDAAGQLGDANLHPGAAETGRVGALLGLGDGRALLADEVGGQARYGVFDPANPTAFRPATACLPDLAPLRPVALALDDDRLALAGWAGFDARTLWVLRADAAGEGAQIWTLGDLTPSGTARVALGFSPVGGLFVGSTLCGAADAAACRQDETADPRPFLWHTDADGGSLGGARDPECP